MPSVMKEDPPSLMHVRLNLHVYCQQMQTQKPWFSACKNNVEDFWDILEFTFPILQIKTHCNTKVKRFAWVLQFLIL